MFTRQHDSAHVPGSAVCRTGTEPVSMSGSGGERFAVQGIVGNIPDSGMIYEHPEQWVTQSLERLALQIDASYNTNRFVPPCIESDLYGVHFVDKIFGCDVFYQDNQWYNRYLDCKIGTLQKPDLDKSEPWRLAKRVAMAFVSAKVALPLFGLPVIASALNIAVNLFGSEILVSMLLEPDKARHDLQVINQTLCEMHRWYRETIPYQQLQPVVAWHRTQPPGYGQLCGCTTQLVSPETYDRLIMDLDSELLSVYPHGGMIHLCGSHTHLIPSFRSMNALKSIQLNDKAAHDLPEYLEGLRQDQVIYLNPCEGMPIEQAKTLDTHNRVIYATDIQM